MVDVVAQNTPQNPYQEFTYVIKAQANGANRQKIFYAHNYFRVLSLSAATLSAVFYGSTQSSIVGAGIGYQLPQVLPWIELVNTGAADITVTVALAVGVINDNRLSVSGNVSTVPIIPATLTTFADVAVGAGAKVKVLSSNGNTKTAFISNLAANNTLVRVGDVNTGAARGVEVGIGGTITIEDTGDIYVFNPAGGGINIGVMATQT